MELKNPPLVMQKIMTKGSIIAYLADFSSKNNLSFVNSHGTLTYTGSGNVERAIVDLYELLQSQNPKIAEQLPAFDEICPQYLSYLGKTDNFRINLIRQGVLETAGLTLTEKGYAEVEADKKSRHRSTIITQHPAFTMAMVYTPTESLQERLEDADIPTKPKSKLGAVLGAGIMTGAGVFSVLYEELRTASAESTLPDAKIISAHLVSKLTGEKITNTNSAADDHFCFEIGLSNWPTEHVWYRSTLSTNFSTSREEGTVVANEKTVNGVRILNGCTGIESGNVLLNTSRYHQIIMSLDPHDAVRESNEANNNLTLNFSVLDVPDKTNSADNQSKPDIGIDKIELRDDSRNSEIPTLKLNRGDSASAYVFYSGMVREPQTYNIILQTYINEVYDSVEIRLNNATAAGTGYVRAYVPAKTLLPGTYTIIAKIDSHELDDRNEGNNQKSLTFEVIDPSTQQTTPQITSIIDENKIIQISDLHIGADGADRQLHDFVQKILALPKLPKYIIGTGDIANYGYGPGSVENYQKVLDEIKPLEDAGVSFLFVPGNHDYRAKADVIGSAPYIGSLEDLINDRLANYHSAAGDGDISEKAVVEPEYAIIGLNSGHDRFLDVISADLKPEGSGLKDSQIHWLENTLDGLDGVKNEKDTSGKVKIIALHHPAMRAWLEEFRTGETIAQNVDKFTELMKQYGVVLVLAGHTHEDSVFTKDGTSYVETASLGFGGGAWREISISSDGSKLIASIHPAQALHRTISATTGSPVDLQAFDSSGMPISPDASSVFAVNGPSGSKQTEIAVPYSPGMSFKLL